MTPKYLSIVPLYFSLYDLFCFMCVPAIGLLLRWGQEVNFFPLNIQWTKTLGFLHTGLSLQDHTGHSVYGHTGRSVCEHTDLSLYSHTGFFVYDHTSHSVHGHTGLSACGHTGFSGLKRSEPAVFFYLLIFPSFMCSFCSVVFTDVVSLGSPGCPWMCSLPSLASCALGSVLPHLRCGAIAIFWGASWHCILLYRSWLWEFGLRNTEGGGGSVQRSCGYDHNQKAVCRRVLLRESLGWKAE